MTLPRIVFVTDPMCSWCWGMAAEIDRTRLLLGEQFEFDLLLGGINTSSTLPVGAYGRKRFEALWREVTAVTGQGFSGRLPHERFVYNSVVPCRVLHAARAVSGEAPFALLRVLQRRFFAHAEDICSFRVLVDAAREAGIDELSLRRALADPELDARVKGEFESARDYGTQALPAVLIENRTGRRLVAGGYVAADVLAEQLEAFTAAC